MFHWCFAVELFLNGIRTMTRWYLVQGYTTNRCVVYGWKFKLSSMGCHSFPKEKTTTVEQENAFIWKMDLVCKEIVHGDSAIYTNPESVVNRDYYTSMSAILILRNECFVSCIPRARARVVHGFSTRRNTIIILTSHRWQGAPWHNHCQLSHPEVCLTTAVFSWRQDYLALHESCSILWHTG